MSDLLVLSAPEVEAALPMADCIDAMRTALAVFSSDDVYNPLRAALRAPFDAPGLLATMPAIRSGEDPAYALKELCIVAANHERGLDSHQGSVLLHDWETGELKAVLNASAVTGIRTAAATAAATDALAPADTPVQALIGVGVQARWHLEALSIVRPASEIRIASRSAPSATRFADRWSGAHEIVAVESAEAAVRGAHLVTAVTSSTDPVVRRDWLDDGVHLNGVGACFPHTREFDTATMHTCRLFVDSRESTFAESGDYLLANLEPEAIVAEIGEVLNGTASGRQSADEITLFKSLGVAIEDLVAAQVACARALENDIGTVLDF